MKLKDKLNQTDADNVVSNTANNEAVKQVSKLPTSEQLALGEEVVDVEIANEVNKGSLAPEEAIKVKDDLRNNTNKTTGVSSQFKDALKFLIPQAVGAAVGGLAGGGRAAVKGAETGALIATGLRKEERANQASRLNNGPRITEDLVHSDTGRPLLMNKSTGVVTDHNGNIVPQAKILNNRFARENRLAEIGSRRTQQADDRLSLGKIKESRLSNQGAQRIAQSDIRIEQSQRRIDENESEDFRKATKDLRSRKPFQQAESILSEAPTIRGLVDDAFKNGGQSLSILGPKIAKGIAGEVGVLTEQDVTRYVSNPQLAQKALDTYSKLTKGKLTGESKDNILRMLEVMETVARGRIKDMTAEEATLLSRRENISKQEAQFKIDPTAKAPETQRQKLERLRKKKAGK